MSRVNSSNGMPWWQHYNYQPCYYYYYYYYYNSKCRHGSHSTRGRHTMLTISVHASVVMSLETDLSVSRCRRCLSTDTDRLSASRITSTTLAPAPQLHCSTLAPSSLRATRVTFSTVRIILVRVKTYWLTHM